LKIFYLKSSMMRLVNYCIKTGRAGWVIRRFKVSRITFKEFVNKASFMGVKKSNW
jgi:small subunit ribosomal protein S14